MKTAKFNILENFPLCGIFRGDCKYGEDNLGGFHFSLADF